MFRRGTDDGPGPNVYQINQKILAIGDDFDIVSGAGQRAFHVDGKAFRIHDTMVLEDASGGEIYRIQKKLVAVHETWTVEDGQGTVATVQKALFSPLHERYDVDLRGSVKWEVTGKITDHEYAIAAADRTIAGVSKKWFSVRDTYGVQVAPGGDDALVIAVAIVIDRVSHPAR